MTEKWNPTIGPEGLLCATDAELIAMSGDSLHIIGWFEVEAGSGELHQCMVGTDQNIVTTCGTYGALENHLWSNDRGMRCRRCVLKDADMKFSHEIERKAERKKGRRRG